jgi:hypothetical protein
MRHAAPVALLVLLATGCAAPAPAPHTAADAGLAGQPPALAPGWVLLRDFSFTVREGVAVPVVGSSHTSYEGLLVACGMFELPASAHLRRLTLWLNSTPDDVASASVGGVTFDLRHDDPAVQLGYRRHDAEAAGPRSYVLVLDDPPAAGYLVNFKAEQATLNGHAQGRYILEGSGLNDDGEPPGLLKGCKA